LKRAFILLSFISPTILYGAALSESAKTDVIVDDVFGGLATSVPAHKLSNGFSPNLLNVDIENGSIRQINGFIEIGSTNTLISGRGIFPYNLEDGSKFYLVTDSSVVLETSDFTSYVFVSSGYNTGVLMRCSQIEEKMWCSNGVDSVFTWNHTSKSILDGTKGTPNVPKGKYISYYQDKVWMFNVPSDASVVYFSDSRSTNGVIIAPDNYLAWPADNFRFIGRGDGQNGTAVWNENGRLKFGKERSIYTMFGDNSSNYIPILTNPSVGVASHDSVVMLDGQSHFVGNDGIYRNEVRISDLIEDEADSIVKTSVRTVSNLWESQGDFFRGEFYGTMATAAGLLTIVTESTMTSTINTFYGETSGPTLNSGTTFYVNHISFGNAVSSNSNVYTSRVHYTALPGSSGELRYTNTNLATGKFVETTGLGCSDLSSGVDFYISSQSPVFTGYEIYGGSYAVKWELVSGGPTCDLYEYGHALSNHAITLTPTTTAQYVSEISTFTSNTAWGKFDSLRNTNGGSVDFFIRTSTSIVNITTKTWSPIIPGVTIGEPTQNLFVQWAATITSVSSFTNTTNVDNVEIVHVEGEGALNRPFATKWKGNYWLFVSTSADTISSYGLKKSLLSNKNPDAWMPISGINIRSILNASDSVLYAGSSSSGTFYRLDFGNSFNGSAIISVYETPDWFGDSLFREKTLLEYYLTAEKGSSSSFKFGLSIDGGDFTDTSVSLNGSGRLNRNIANVSGKGKYFRWRIKHDVYDEPFEFYNFGVVTKPSDVRRGIND